MTRLLLIQTLHQWQKNLILKDECSLCGTEYDAECGGIQCNFGSIPVTFCEWCYSSIMDMAKYHLGIKDNDG